MVYANVNQGNTPGWGGDVYFSEFDVDWTNKPNINNVSTAKLVQIDGKRYVMKTDTSDQKIGLLAQDVQAVFPELVKEANNEEGTLSVNYQGLIPVLINAIKEQQQEINELKKIIKNN